MDDLNKPSTQENEDQKISRLLGEAMKLQIAIPDNFNSKESSEKITLLEKLIDEKKNMDTKDEELREDGDAEEDSEKDVTGDPEIQKTREVIYNVLDDFGRDLYHKSVKDYINGFEISIGKAGEVPNKIEINRNERTISIEAGLSYDEIKKTFIDLYINRPNDPEVPAEPDFQSEGESAEKPFDISQIDQDILDELKKIGISLETIPTQLSTVNYQEDERKIYIRNDADPETVNNIIRDTILNDMSGGADAVEDKEKEPVSNTPEESSDAAEIKEKIQSATHQLLTTGKQEGTEIAIWTLNKNLVPDPTIEGIEYDSASGFRIGKNIDTEAIAGAFRFHYWKEHGGKKNHDEEKPIEVSSSQKKVQEAPIEDKEKKGFEKKFEIDGIEITIHDNVYVASDLEELNQIKEEIKGAINDLKPDKDNPTDLLARLREKYPGFKIDVVSTDKIRGILYLANQGTLFIPQNSTGSEIRDYIKKQLLDTDTDKKLEIQNDNKTDSIGILEVGGKIFKIGDEVLIENSDSYKSKGKVSSFYWSSNQKRYLVEVVAGNSKELVEPERLSLVKSQPADKITANPADVPPPPPADTTLKPLEDNGKGTSAEIQSAEGNNGVILKINDKVSWVLSSGALNTGEIQSFSQDSFGIVAHIMPDSDPSTEVELLAVELSLFDGKNLPKSGSQVPLPTSAPTLEPQPIDPSLPPGTQVPPVTDPKVAPDPTKKVEAPVKTEAQSWREKILKPEEIDRLSDLRTRIFKLEKSGKTTEEDGTTLATLKVELERCLDELIKPIDPQINSLSERVKSHFQANGVIDADRIETSSKKIIFEIVVRGEQEERMKLLKASREGSKWGKAGEALRSVVGTKAISWYLKQSRTKRFVINATLIGAAVGGATFLSTGSVGMALGGMTLRTARAAASFVGGNAGALGGEWVGKKVTGISGVASNIDKEKEEAIKKTKSDNSINEAEKNKQIKQAEDIANERKKNLWDEWYKQEVEKIWKSAGSREEMSKALKDLEKKYKNKKWTVTGATILGALAGGVSGALAADMTAPDKSNIGRSGLSEKTGTKGENANAAGAQETSANNSAAGDSTHARGAGDSSPDLTNRVSTTERIPGISIEKAQFVPEKGGTLWGGVGKILENNPQYKDLSPEGKEFMQSTYLNKIIENRENLGLEADTDYGVKLKIGQKIDLAKVFNNDDEFNKLIAKAKDLSPEQKKNIQTNDKLIADWIKSHPGQKATIAEINKLLSGDYEKPSTGAKEFTPPSSVGESLAKGAKIYYDYDSGPQVDYSGNTVGSKALDEMSSDFDSVRKGIDDLANQQESISEKIANIKSSAINDPTWNNVPPPESSNDDMAKMGGSAVGLAALGKVVTDMKKDPAELAREIEEAKRRLQVLEGGRKTGDSKDGVGSLAGGVGGSILRTMAGDKEDFERQKINAINASTNKTEKIQGEVSLDRVELALKSGVDSIFGKPGILGLGKVSGVESKPWQFIQGLKYEDVLEYFKKGSSEFLVNPTQREELGNSNNTQKYIKLMKEIVELEGKVASLGKANLIKTYKMELGKREKLSVKEYLKSLISLIPVSGKELETGLKKAA